MGGVSMKLLRKIAPVMFATAAIIGISLLIHQNTFALTLMEGVQAARGEGQPTELFGGSGTGVVTTAVNILLFVVGALSVIMLIIGGLRYVISGGNSSAVTAAKNTILYAIVGLIVAFVAYAAVNFVISAVAPGSSGFGGGGTNV